jgi:hypothetical protein
MGGNSAIPRRLQSFCSGRRKPCLVADRHRRHPGRIAVYAILTFSCSVPSRAGGTLPIGGLLVSKPFVHLRLVRPLVVIDCLCGAPHKQSYVAKLVMWRPASSLDVSAFSGSLSAT